MRAAGFPFAPLCTRRQPSLAQPAAAVAMFIMRLQLQAESKTVVFHISFLLCVVGFTCSHSCRSQVHLVTAAVRPDGYDSIHYYCLLTQFMWIACADHAAAVAMFIMRLQ
jgi:hypothetical protein